jgi:hypothetical protein
MLLFRNQQDCDIFNQRLSDFLEINYNTKVVPIIEIDKNTKIIKPWNAGINGQQVAWNKGLNKTDPRVLRHSRPMTEELKIKISQKLMGHDVSTESRQKMSDKKKGKSPWNKGRTFINTKAKRVKVTNGTLIFNSVKDAAEHEMISPSAIIGRIKRSSGWFYVNDN